MFDDRKQKVGIFKPQDEEPFNINNPKGFSPRSPAVDIWAPGFKEGILVGEASVRECAASLLDHQHFSGVPATDLVLCQHPAFYSNPEEDSFVVRSPGRLLFLSEPLTKKLKLGSFQEFMEHDGDTEDISHSLLAKFPVDEVHKIAVLDVRLFNEDRHGGNILHKQTKSARGEKKIVLIPIDHGYTIPSTLAEAWFEWHHWPQSKEKMSDKTKEYISTLDAEKDVALLSSKFGRVFRQEHFRTLRICTMLLKMCAVADLTFYQIANIMCRLNIDQPSVLENLYTQAEMKVGLKDEGEFLSCLEVLISLEIEGVQNVEDENDLMYAM